MQLQAVKQEKRKHVAVPTFASLPVGHGFCGVPVVGLFTVMAISPVRIVSAVYAESATFLAGETVYFPAEAALARVIVTLASYNRRQGKNGVKQEKQKQRKKT